MSPEDKLQKVLEYTGHLSDCDTECGWDCDCGWEQIESKLAKEKEMLNDEFELDPEARATLERWEKVSAKMTEDMKDHIKGLISDLEATLKFGNGRIWLGLNANVMLAHSIYGVDRFDGTPDFSETGWFEAKGRRGAVEHTRRKRTMKEPKSCPRCQGAGKVSIQGGLPPGTNSPEKCVECHGSGTLTSETLRHHEKCGDPMGCHPDCKMRRHEGGWSCSHPDCESGNWLPGGWCSKASRDRSIPPDAFDPKEYD